MEASTCNPALWLLVKVLAEPTSQPNARFPTVVLQAPFLLPGMPLEEPALAGEGGGYGRAEEPARLRASLR